MVKEEQTNSLKSEEERLFHVNLLIYHRFDGFGLRMRCADETEIEHQRIPFVFFVLSEEMIYEGIIRKSIGGFVRSQLQCRAKPINTVYYSSP